MDPQPRRDGPSGAPPHRERHPRAPAVALVVLLGGALLLALTVWTIRSESATPAQEPRASLQRFLAGSTGTDSFTLMQTNLCLSGLAHCNGWAYPAVIREAIARVRQVRPDAVTLNEGCGRDARHIARATGYHVRFTRIRYAGAWLRCTRPGGRGLFGDGVLTRAPIVSARSRRFEAQEGPEVRRWLCVGTRRGPQVCTAHLEVREIGDGRPNDAQCAELGRLLGRLAGKGPVIFGGDVNRLASCAPAGFWTATDRGAAQDPGIQHVYGTGEGLGPPTSTTVRARYTDHDVLLVRTQQRR